ncbi:VPA1269 family protein [Rhizobium leguminosarum]|uniref:VPA1269 family protein n=1 Tax=Rhizobium leguminosarum TaxID=384 RepID=UPI0013F47642|nr:VPA1269 family protein [Rhizobium leguminosarum]
MLKYFKKGNALVGLNVSDHDCFNDGSLLGPKLTAALKMIRAIPSQREPTPPEFAAADFLFDEGVIISPRTVFRKGRPLHRAICTHFNNLSPFGVALRERLEDEGCFDFLKTVNSYNDSVAVLERAITVLAMSTDGLESVNHVPPELLNEYVDYFRTEDGLRWQQQIFGIGYVSKQSMSQFVAALSRIYPGADLSEKSRQHRTATGGRRTWAFHTSSKDPQVQEILRFHDLYKSEALTDPSKVQKAIQLLLDYLTEREAGRSIREVLERRSRSVTFGEYMTAKVGAVTRHVVDTVRIAKNFADFIFETLVAEHQQADLFPLISERELSKVTNGLIKSERRRTTAAARPLPEKVFPLVREILDEGQLGWPGKCGHFDVKISHAGKPLKLYCPVIPTILSAAFDIPLRIVQLRRLDSGEGDTRRFNADSMSWEDNDGPHAGYWADQAGLPHEDFETRGYARLIRDPLKDVTGFFINTNKTGMPYEVPWEHERLHKAFWNLRKWQEKYNPVTRPIMPGDYVDQKKRLSEKTKARMPPIFGLARLFPIERKTMVGRIVLHDEVEAGYVYVLREAERRWRNLYPDIPMELVRRDPNGSYRPLYGMHGLRVRGITNLHRSGMPLEVISKFVAGHATLMMTSYYLKITAAEIQNMLENAAENSRNARDLIESFKTMKLDEARRRAVSLDPTAISEAVASKSKLEFCNVDYGFCPWDATRCDDGGPVLREDSQNPSKAVYGPVPGGRNNCIMCRHFVSGPPFLVQLQAVGIKLCERREHLAHQEARINAAVGELEAGYRAKSLETGDFRNKLDVLQQQIIAIKDDQEIAENSIFNVEVLCNAAARLMATEKDPSGATSLIANSRESVIEYLQVTPFERNAWLVAASRIYPVLDEPRIEENRNRYVELVLFNSKMVPPRLMNSITEEEARKAMDLYSHFLLARTSRTQIQALANGELTLRDVGLESEMKKLLTSVSENSHVALQAPTTHLLMAGGVN